MKKPTAKSVEEVNIYLEGLALRLPETSTDNSVTRFDGTGGALQGSGVTINDSGEVVAAGFVRDGSGATYDQWFVDGVRRFVTQTVPSSVGFFAADDSGVWSGSGKKVYEIDRATGKFTLRQVGSTAGLEFGSSGPRMTVDTGKVVLGTSTAAADPAKSLVTKDYVDTGLPTISVDFTTASWSAGTYTSLPMSTVYAAGNLSSYNRDDWFYDLSTGGGKTYFRVRKRGLYLVSGSGGWNWTGDSYRMPVSGVIRADADQYIQFGMWLNQPNGGSAAQRCFGYPAVQGNAQSHVIGNVYMASAIGGSPLNLFASLAFTRIGD